MCSWNTSFQTLCCSKHAGWLMISSCLLYLSLYSGSSELAELGLAIFTPQHQFSSTLRLAPLLWPGPTLCWPAEPPSAASARFARACPSSLQIARYILVVNWSVQKVAKKFAGLELLSFGFECEPLASAPIQHDCMRIMFCSSWAKKALPSSWRPEYRDKSIQCIWLLA